MSRAPGAMRSARTLLLGAALALGACRDGEPGSGDHDGDGSPAFSDCDDFDPAVHATVTAYPDADGDGFGAGAAATFCTDGTLPRGYAAQGGDCAARDASAWRAADLVDRDGDGRTAKDPVAICAGATLPEPYRAAASGNDCDDANPDLFEWVVAYRDEDGDGVGARPRSILCLGAALPSGWSRLGYDVDDADPAVARDPADDGLALIVD